MIHFSTQKIKILEHATFWLFMYLFVFDYHFLENNWAEAIGRTFLEVFTYAVIIYLNLFVFIPFLLQKKRVVSYIISMIITVIGYVLIMRWSGLEEQFYTYSGWRNVFSMVLNTSLFLLISSLYWFFKQGQIEREKHFIVKNEKLEAELSFLRTQISPHFIFNTLNNIYTLAIQKHDNTAPMVAKLATLLRYVLYDGSEGQILLKKEIDTLKQYIELHLLRKPRSKNVDFYTEGGANGWKIAPMLLINFVENAFKHSNLDNDEQAWIKIDSDISDDGQLIFSIENSMSPSVSLAEVGGIGLQNVRRQLELNYPDNYSLTLKNDAEVFHIQLNLQLKKA